MILFVSVGKPAIKSTLIEHSGEIRLMLSVVRNNFIIKRFISLKYDHFRFVLVNRYALQILSYLPLFSMTSNVKS
jgi:hypothetical protein